MERVVLQTEIPEGDLFSRGKVRDNWLMPGWPGPGDERPLLMITTDRISAFDVVMREGVPDLGKIRNQISLFWFKRLRDICPNHIFISDEGICAGVVSRDCRERNDLIGRSVLVDRADVFPVECVVRGYLYGSAWEEYKKDGTACGIKLPQGLREAEILPTPIFTPTTKSESGHDEPFDFGTMVKMVGDVVAEILRSLSVALYKEASRHTEECGIIIADTKFEFGLYRGKQIILVDELLTPDSSRFWDAVTYKPGGSQPSFDKQHLRDWLEEVGWDKQSPPPTLPKELIERLRDRYIEAYERLVGKRWPPKF